MNTLVRPLARPLARGLAAGAALVLALGCSGVGSASAATSPSTPTTPTKVARSQLTTGTGTGTERTYEALVVDTAGRKVTGAKLDLGGLGDNPDLRVKTTPMTPVAGDPSRYRATVTFPSDGDWVLVVRVQEPSQAVDLFTEKITGVGTLSSHDLSANPSKRAVIRQAPNFYELYDGTGQLGTPTASVPANQPGSPVTIGHSTGTAAAGTGTIDAGHSAATAGAHGFDAAAAAFLMVHSFGAMAWMAAVLGLVLANRLGTGTARTEITKFIARNYTVLAGGGLLAVTFSGVQTALSSSAGLDHPAALLDSRLGTAYLAVFALKMTLVIGSVITTYRLGRLLPTPARLLNAPRIASLGAMANHHPAPRIYRLAEANAALGALIIGCVVLLGQLHHAIA